MTSNNSVWMEKVPDARTFSPLKKNISTDVVIIGSGIAGALAAWKLTQAGKQVVILEKNHVATGDTSATTGFLTRVPDASCADLQERYGAEFLAQIFSASKDAQQFMFNLIKGQNIDCDFMPVFSYYCSYKERDSIIKREWECIQKADSQTKLVQAGKSKAPFMQAIQFEGEGKFHSRKFIFGLLKRSGATVYEETEALSVTSGKSIVVKTPTGTVTAKKVILAIGNPSSLFPELGPLLHSKVSYVVSAKYQEKPPISENLFWDTLDPYFYYRKVDENTIICGGCDVDFDAVHRQDPFPNLEMFLADKFPGDYNIEHRWSGSLFHTTDNLPYAFEHPFMKNVYVATGVGGNGLIFGSLCGRTVASLALGTPLEVTSLLSLQRTGAQVVPLQDDSQESSICEVPLSELSEGKLLKKTVGKKSVLVAKTKTGYCALSNLCTHAGGELHQGSCDGEAVVCPLHGARFNLSTGEVLAPPATRPLERFDTKIQGDKLMFQVSGDATPKERTWPLLLGFTFIALAFLAGQVALQYFIYSKDDIFVSLIRGCSFTGLTLISLALFSSAVFKWFPSTGTYWRLRRYLGVAGFVFILGHAEIIMWKYFGFQASQLFTSFNPVQNPLLFGVLSMPIFMLMALTSTDWAVNLLTPKWWKRLHRLVYIAFYASIAHFLYLAGPMLFTPPGYVLMAVSGLAVLGEVYWFIRTLVKKA